MAGKAEARLVRDRDVIYRAARAHPFALPLMLPTNKRDAAQPAQDPAKKRRRGANRLSCAECRRSVLVHVHSFDSDFGSDPD